jgi:hypothetical protein
MYDPTEIRNIFFRKRRNGTVMLYDHNSLKIKFKPVFE